MFQGLVRGAAKTKILARKDEIRQVVFGVDPADRDTIIQLIQEERDIIQFLQQEWISKITENKTLFNAVANTEFLLGLTSEILPEYHELLKGKRNWIDRQVVLIRKAVG